MFINSSPPMFRKARELAVTIENFEATFLTHTSYVDTTNLQTDIPNDLIDEALQDPDRNHGALSPSLQEKIRTGVDNHEVMEPEFRDKVLEES